MVSGQALWPPSYACSVYPACVLLAGCDICTWLCSSRALQLSGWKVCIAESGSRSTRAIAAQPPARLVQEFYGGAVRDGEDAPAEAAEAPTAAAEAAEVPAAGAEAPAEAPVAAAEAPAEVAEAPAAPEEDAPGAA